MKLISLLCLLLPLIVLGQKVPGPSQNAVDEKFQRMQSAMESKNEATTTVSESRSLPKVAFEVAIALVLVLGIAIVSIRVLRKIQRGMFKGSTARGDLLEVLETCHLGPNQKLVAVRVDGKIGVLGVSKEQIAWLTSVERPAKEVLTEHQQQGNPVQFADNLNRMLEKFKKPKKVSEFPNA